MRTQGRLALIVTLHECLLMVAFLIFIFWNKSEKTEILLVRVHIFCSSAQLKKLKKTSVVIRFFSFFFFKHRKSFIVDGDIWMYTQTSRFLCKLIRLQVSLVCNVLRHLQRKHFIQWKQTANPKFYTKKYRFLLRTTVCSWLNFFFSKEIFNSQQHQFCHYFNFDI